MIDRLAPYAFALIAALAALGGWSQGVRETHATRLACYGVTPDGARFLPGAECVRRAP